MLAKIGLLTVGYGKTTWVNRVFEPWIKRKDTIISAAHGQFSQFGEDGQHSDMKAWFEFNFKNKKNIDLNIIEGRTLSEADLRNVALSALQKKGFDYLFLLDARDEIYTTEQIEQIMSFVQRKPDIAWFKVQFKNYVIFEGKKAFYYGFNPPRIWNNHLAGGIKKFYHDNDVLYNEDGGLDQKYLSNLVIPNVPIDHYSWVGTEKELKEKVDYQQSRWRHCSFKMTSKGLTFDLDYYQKYKIPLPKIFFE